MGGGKKNKSLSQMTKEKKPRENKKEKAAAAPTTKKINLGLTVPDVNNKKVLGELKGLKVLTPSVVASRLNVKLSIANAFLKEMEKRKLVEFVSGGKNIKIYKQVSAAKPAEAKAAA
jgi:small subunit ribosomal protein S25e